MTDTLFDLDDVGRGRPAPTVDGRSWIRTVIHGAIEDGYAGDLSVGALAAIIARGLQGTAGIRSVSVAGSEEVIHPDGHLTGVLWSVPVHVSALVAADGRADAATILAAATNRAVAEMLPPF